MSMFWLKSTKSTIVAVSWPSRSLQSGRSLEGYRACRNHSTLSLSDSSLLYERDLGSVSPNNFTNDTLRSLVEQRKYGAADRVRLQLLEDGVAIQQNAIYEHAAIAALEWQLKGRNVGLFTAWFSLVLDKDHPDSDPLNPHPFSATRDALLRSGSPAQTLPFVMRYGILCASKGHIRAAFSDTLRVVTKFAQPQFGAMYLLEMESEATRYVRLRRPGEEGAIASEYRAAAVEVCCQTGWFHEAINILRRDRDFPLKDSTYKYLLQNLKSTKHSAVLAEVQQLRLQDEARRANSNFRSRGTMSTDLVQKVR